MPNNFGDSSEDRKAGTPCEEICDAQLAQERLSLEQAKDQFLGNLSHELRTPLTSVLGLSSLLLEGVAGPLNEKQSRYVGIMREQGLQMLSVINDLLDLASLEMDEMQLQPQLISLTSVCQSSLNTVQAQAERQQVNLCWQCDLRDDRLMTDPLRLNQILSHLLTNALKFTPTGGTVRLTLSSLASEAVALSVSDTGIGIPTEKLQSLFAGFQQLEPSLTRRVGGLGIGLALSVRLVKLLGGRITVESRLGGGSTFCLHLPVRAALNAADQTASAQH